MMTRAVKYFCSWRSLLRAMGVALVAILGFSIVGCGDGSGASGEKEPLKIGVMVPSSGVYAQMGNDINDAMEMYFEEQGNEIAGRPVELVREDTETDPQVGVQAAQNLMQREEVDVLTGGVSSSVAYGTFDLVEREQIPFVISNATGNDLTREGSDYVFRTSGTNWQVSYPMGAWLVDKGIEDMYVSAADYASGQEVAENFKGGFTEAGGSIVGEAFPPLGTNDYSSYITQIDQADAQGTFSFYAGSDAVRFVQQYSRLSSEVPLFGPGYMVAADTLPAQGEAAIGVRSAAPYASTLDTPENQEFVENFRNTYDRDPSVYAVGGWDAAWLVAEAVKATEGNTEDTESLIEAMENVEFESPRGPMKLDENHNPVQNIYVREVRKQDSGDLKNIVIDTFEDVKDPGE